MLPNLTRSLSLWVLMVITAIAGCIPEDNTPRLIVSLVADGRERTFEYTVPVTVGEFLGDAELEVGELDRVNPPEFTQITDGMRVTVVRVTQEVECEEEEIPFRQRTVPNEGLEAGEERLGQAGQAGTEQICYRVNIEDGVRRDSVEIGREILVEPQDEVVYVGPTGEVDPIPVEGTLAYINNGNAWVIRGSTTAKRPLTTNGDVDGRAFELAPDGERLLFTRQSLPGSGDGFFNQLYIINNTASTNAEPVALVPGNVLYAEWIPGVNNTISYSTGEPRAAAPGWQALNDLWTMRIDPRSGDSLSVDQVLEPSSGGLYGWWGTQYEWSRDGSQLAWVRADSIGLVDLASGELTTLIEYPVFNTFQPWSWRATISWSPDNQLLLTTVHGLPIGSEPPETSPAFHVAVTDTAGSFNAEIFRNAGIWASPQYSPLLNTGSEFPEGRMAYLRCRDFPNCVNPTAEYDLIVADRDGSNTRVVFPEDGQRGLSAQDFAWSPDGQQIALIYLGNLWIVDVDTAVASQLTIDGGASQPRWAR